MSFISGITLLLIYQLVGEVSVLYLSLPVPGPVLGLILLFLTLMIRGGAPTSLEKTGNTLLSHLSLLFVPAGVGMVVHLNLITEQWLPILLTLVLSTLITLAATAGVFWLSAHWLSGKE